MKRFFLLLIMLSIISSCTVLYRAVRYGSEDIDDYNIFLTYDLSENQNKFYFDEVDGDGAAKIMGKSKKQLANLLYRAKQALKTELEKEGFCYEDR